MATRNGCCRRGLPAHRRSAHFAPPGMTVSRSSRMRGDLGGLPAEHAFFAELCDTPAVSISREQYPLLCGVASPNCHAALEGSNPRKAPCPSDVALSSSRPTPANSPSGWRIVTPGCRASSAAGGWPELRPRRDGPAPSTRFPGRAVCALQGRPAGANRQPIARCLVVSVRTAPRPLGGLLRTARAHRRGDAVFCRSAGGRRSAERSDISVISSDPGFWRGRRGRILHRSCHPEHRSRRPRRSRFHRS